MAYAKLNGVFVSLSGKSGDLVFADTNKGTIMRQRSRTPRVSTVAQLAAQRRMSLAAGNYDNLSDAQIALWTNYAKTITLEKRGGEKYNPNPFNVYTGLASKLQQVNPAAALLSNAPASHFEGDTVTVTATVASGKINFTANKANAVDVTTELLLQPLVKKTRRTYLSDYRTAMFFAFATGSLFTSVSEILPGWYAIAYRFVNSKTGQDVAIVPLGKVQII